MMQGSYPPHGDPRYSYPPPPQHHPHHHHPHHGGHAYPHGDPYEGAPHLGYAAARPDAGEYGHGDSEDDDDDDDDVHEGDNVIRPQSSPAIIPRKEPRLPTSAANEDGSDNDDEDDDDDNDDDEEEQPEVIKPAPPQGRGKPESMAIALGAATALESARDGLTPTSAPALAVATADDDDGDDDDDDDPMEVEAVAETETPEAPASAHPPLPAAAKAKPKPAASAAAKKKAPPKKKPTMLTSAVAGEEPRTELLLDEEPTPITEEEYENLEALMIQFCRVPLLAEFSRPVALLHPEVSYTIDCFSIAQSVFCVCLIAGRRKLNHSCQPLFFCSWPQVMTKSSNTRLTWVMCAEEFVGDSTKTLVTFALTCGESLPTVSSFIPIQTTRKPYRPLFRLPCIFESISTACGRNTCCLRNYLATRLR